MICSSATGSASTVNSGPSSAMAGEMPRRASSGSSRYSALRAAASRLTCSSWPPRSGCSTARRRRLTTSLARLAWSVACAMAVLAVPRSARSGGSSASRRPAAWVDARMAVSGWLSSCARPAASSPSVFNRPIWPRRSSSSARWRSWRWRNSARAASSSTATVSAQLSIQAHGNCAQPTWRSATRTNGWLSALSGLRKSKCQPRAGSRTVLPGCSTRVCWLCSSVTRTGLVSLTIGHSLHGIMARMSISSA